MRQILSNDRVRLADDLPGLMLERGAVGVVRSAWYYPNVAFEVEFGRGPGRSATTRVLLLEDQVQAADAGAVARDRPRLAAA